MSDKTAMSETPRIDVREHTRALGAASYKLEELAAAFDDASERAETAERELAACRVELDKVTERAQTLSRRYDMACREIDESCLAPRESAHIPAYDDNDFGPSTTYCLRCNAVFGTPAWSQPCVAATAGPPDAAHIPSPAPDSQADIDWLHRFITCTPLGGNAPADDIARAHAIVERLRSRQAPRGEGIEVLNRLSAAITAIGQYGFDKDTTKDEHAFHLWKELNDAQAASAAFLKRN